MGQAFLVNKGMVLKPDLQSKSVIPTTTEQTILPDEDYDYLSQVVVAAIPYMEGDNSAGGKTVTIG